MRCIENLENLGDVAMDSKNYDEAIKHYSDALSLGPTNQCDILLKRSKVRAVMGSWEEALIDADKVWIVCHVTSDGLSHLCYPGYRARPIIPQRV